MWIYCFILNISYRLMNFLLWGISKNFFSKIAKPKQTIILAGSSIRFKYIMTRYFLRLWSENFSVVRITCVPTLAKTIQWQISFRDSRTRTPFFIQFSISYPRVCWSLFSSKRVSFQKLSYQKIRLCIQLKKFNVKPWLWTPCICS